MEINNQSEQYLTKQLSRLFHRIERIIVPSNSMVNSNIGMKLGYLLNRVKSGEFFENSDTIDGKIQMIENPKTEIVTSNQNRRKSDRFAITSSNSSKTEFIPRKVIWDPLQSVLISTILEEMGIDSLPEKIATEIEDERSAQEEIQLKHKSKLKIKLLQVSLLTFKWMTCYFTAFSILNSMLDLTHGRIEMASRLYRVYGVENLILSVNTSILPTMLSPIQYQPKKVYYSNSSSTLR